MYRWQLPKHWRRFSYVALAGSLAAIGLACGGSSDSSTEPSDPSKGSLTGKITYNGKPFPGYIVVQSEANHHSAKAMFAQNGSYTVTSIPIGKAKLGLRPPPHPRRRPTPGGQVSEIKQPRRIPDQYHDPSKSGLIVEIHAGKNEYSVDLN